MKRSVVFHRRESLRTSCTTFTSLSDIFGSFLFQRGVWSLSALPCCDAVLLSLGCTKFFTTVTLLSSRLPTRVRVLRHSDRRNVSVPRQDYEVLLRTRGLTKMSQNRPCREGGYRIIRKANTSTSIKQRSCKRPSGSYHS